MKGLSALLLAGTVATMTLGISQANAAIPTGWSCTGACGLDGANGVVTLSPTGSAQYEYVSTAGGASGAGQLPGLGGTNGSQLNTSVFAANAGSDLRFDFNYVTSDGAGYADYGWAQLFTDTDVLIATLFTGRTAPSGTIAPGLGLPAIDATLTPSSVPIVSGGPSWNELGGYSGRCWATGCGYTGWVQSEYTITTGGNYYLAFGVTNWSDTAYDSGMAIDGLKVDGISITSTPEPASFALLGAGLLGLGMVRRRRA